MTHAPSMKDKKSSVFGLTGLAALLVIASPLILFLLCALLAGLNS